MKRTSVVVLLLVAVVLALFPAFAYAGVGEWFGKVKLAASDQAINWVVSGIFGILSVVLGAWVIKWKRAAHEGIDIIVAIVKAKSAGSPGGKEITKAELDGIIGEITQGAGAFYDAWQTRTEPAK